MAPTEGRVTKPER